MGFLSSALGYSSVITLASSKMSGRPVSTNKGARSTGRIDRKLLEEDYRYDPVTFNIINKQLQIMLHAGFLIKTTKTIYQKEYDEFFENIGDVGEETTKEELVEYILQDMLMYGNSYVELVYKNGDINNEVVDLTIISEKKMDFAKNGKKEIVVDRWGRPVGYVMKLPYGTSSRNLGDDVPKPYDKVVTRNSNEIFFLPQRIAHFKLHTYGERFYGIGLIEPSHASTTRKRKIEEARANEIYTRGANTIIAYVGDSEHDPTKQNLQDTLDNISNWKYDRYFAFPNWVKLDTIQMNDSDATDKTLDYLRVNQAASAGMPLAFATGAGEATNRATLNNQQQILELSLEFVLKKFGSAFNKYVLKRIAKSNGIKEVAKITFGNVKAEEKNDKHKRIVTAVSIGAMAPEEARAYILEVEDILPNEKAYNDFRETEKSKPKKIPGSPFPTPQEEL